MGNRDILIRQVVFDLEIDSQEKFQSYSEAVSLFVRERLTKLLNTLSIQLEIEENMTLDTIEISIENIDINNLELIEEELIEQISLHIAKNKTNNKTRGVIRNDPLTLLELFQFIADYGFLPWSFKTKEKVNVFFESELTSLQKKTSYLNTLIKKPTGYTRIMNILEVENQKKLLKVVLHPNYKTFESVINTIDRIYNARGLNMDHTSYNKIVFNVLGQFIDKAKLETVISESIAAIRKEFPIGRNEFKPFLKLNKTLDSKQKSLVNNLQGEIIFNKKHLQQLQSIFLTLEKQKGLKETLEKTDFVSSFTSSNRIQKNELLKSVSQISLFYQKAHNISEFVIVQKLIDYLSQTGKRTRFETLLLLILGESVFTSEKYKRIRNEQLFRKIIRKVYPSSYQKYREVVEKILLLFPLQQQLKKENTVRGFLLGALISQKPTSEPSILFLEILKALNQSDPTLVPIQKDKLNNATIVKLYERIEIKKRKSKKWEETHPNYFDFVLNLNNELIQEESPLEFKKPTLFVSSKDILKSTRSLIEFLNVYKAHEEVLSSFSKISLQSATEKAFKSLLKTSFHHWVEVEEALIAVQNQIHFSELDSKQFQSVLRYHFIQSLIGETSSSALFLGEFTYNFLIFIDRDSNLYFNKLKEYYPANSQEYTKDILLGFRAFVDTNPLEELPQKRKTSITYQDVYFYFLKNNKLPDWASYNQIDDFEIVNFIDLLVSKKDYVFLEKLFKDQSIKKNLLHFLKDQNKAYFHRLLQVLTKSDDSNPLSFLYKALTQTTNVLKIAPFLLFEKIIQNQLWEIKSKFVLELQLKVLVNELNPTLLNLLKEKGEDILKGERIEKKLGRSSDPQSFLSWVNVIIDLEANGNLKQIEDKIDLDYLKPYRKETSGFALKDFQNLLNRNIDFENLRLFLNENPESTLQFLLTRSSDIFKSSFLKQLFSQELILNSLYSSFSEDTALVKDLTLFFDEIAKFSTKDKLFYASVEFLLVHFIQEKKSKSLVIPSLLDLVKTIEPKKRSVLIEKLKIKKEESQRKTFEESMLVFDLTKSETSFSILKYYIELGTNTVDFYDLTKAEYLDFIKQQNPLLVKKYLYRWAQSESSKRRVVELFEKEEATKLLVNFVHPRLWKLLQELPDLFNLIFSGRSLPYKFSLNDKEFKNALLTFWSKNKFKPDPHELITSFIRQYLTQTNTSIDVFLTQLNTIVWDAKKEISIVEIRSFLDQATKRKKPSPIELLDENKLMKEELTSGVSIQNAGLVIAWPFLNILFSKLGLLEKGQFKDENAMQKGIVATQFLVSGKNEYEETDLILNKILCGAEIDFYVDPNLVLDEIEVGICEMALKTIVGQWGKVKSVEALRSYFLIRNGVLKYDENQSVNLHIEKETPDILLKFLPWNLSVIKTSIMKTKIVIHWKFN